MTAYYNEHDPHAAAWIRELIKAGHVAPGEVDTRSIADVQADDLRGFTQAHFFAGIGVWSYALRLAGWPDDRPVWTGSPPCQPFSAAGKQKGVDDSRHLWPVFFDLIKVCRPPVLFGEQVGSAIKHGWLDNLQDDLEAEGYASGAVVFPACSVGAPHIRQRLYFVAERVANTERERGGEARVFAGLDGILRTEQNHPVPTEKRSSCCGLADTKHPGRATREDNRRPDRGATADQREVGSGLEYRESAGCGYEEWLADTNHNGRNQDRECFTTARDDGFVGDCADVRMADTSNQGHLRHQRSRPTGQERQPCGHVGERSLSDGGLADTTNIRVKPDTRGLGEGQKEARCQGSEPATNCWIPGKPKNPNENNSKWGTVDWLFCRDGKWRPVESWVGEMAPGTADRLGYRSVGGGYSLSPLQTKAENRVMRLRGYGNSIVAPQAAEFIRAFMEVGK